MAANTGDLAGVVSAAQCRAPLLHTGGDDDSGGDDDEDVCMHVGAHICTNVCMGDEGTLSDGRDDVPDVVEDVGTNVGTTACAGEEEMLSEGRDADPDVAEDIGTKVMDAYGDTDVNGGGLRSGGFRGLHQLGALVMLCGSTSVLRLLHGGARADVSDSDLLYALKHDPYDFRFEECCGGHDAYDESAGHDDDHDYDDMYGGSKLGRLQRDPGRRWRSASAPKRLRR